MRMKTFKDYNFSHIGFPDLLSQAGMLSLNYIGEHKTIVWYGGCGTEKNHGMVTLGIMACHRYYKVKFFNVSQLVLLLKKAHYDGSLEKTLAMFRYQDLFLLDELGYIPWIWKALVMTTNLPFSECGKMFTNDQLGAAMIDRIVHYGHLIMTGDKDWR